jgi:hypothetical protein
VFSGHDFVWSILVPGLVALSISLIGAALKLRLWTAAPALGLAFLAAFPAINFGTWRIPAIVPADSGGWLPIIAILAMIIGIIDAGIRRPLLARAMIVVIVAAIGLWAELKFKFHAGWSRMNGALIICGFAVLAGVWWAALDDLATNSNVLAPLQMWLISAVSGVVLMLVGPVTYGKFCLALAAGSFAMLWRQSPGALRAAATVFAIVFVSILAGGFYLSDLSLLVLAMIASTALFVWIGRWLPSSWKPWKRGLTRLLITLVPLGTALILAVIQFQHEQTSGEIAYYSN